MNRRMIIPAIIIALTSFKLFALEGKCVITEIDKVTNKKIEIEGTPEPLESSGIGNVVYSILATPKFQEVNGKEWEPLRGQKLKEYDNDKSFKSTDNVFDFLLPNVNFSITELPNVGGRFLRVINYNAKDENGTYKHVKVDPDARLLGSAQSDQYKQHTHHTQYGNNRGHNGSSRFSPGGQVNAGNIVKQYVTLPSPLEKSTETRPKNIAVNAFIKVKRKCLKISLMQKTVAELRREIEMLKKQKDN